jgi:hypothetical protein
MVPFVFSDIHKTIKRMPVPFLHFAIFGSPIIAPYEETEFYIETESSSKDRPWNVLSISSTFNLLFKRDVRHFRTN